VAAKGCHVFACGDEAQAVVWLLRERAVCGDGRMRTDLDELAVEVVLPMSGAVRVREFDTGRGVMVREWTLPEQDRVRFEATVVADRAFAVTVVE